MDINEKSKYKMLQVLQVLQVQLIVLDPLAID
jgi:hypothetical protein